MKSIKLSEDGDNLFFLVGCPRSGTTYLQSLMTTSKQLFSFPETHFFSIVTQGILSDKILEEVDHRQIKTGLQKWLPGVILEDKFNSLRRNNIKETFLELLNILSTIESAKGECFLEKTPSHFMKVDLLKELFPRCKIIFILRNPYEVIYSRKNKLPTDKNLSIPHLAESWKKMYQILGDSLIKYPGDIFRVKYESLVKDRNGTIKGLGNFLGIKFNLELLDNYKDESRKLINPIETWKTDVADGATKKVEQESFAFSKHQLFQLQSILNSELTENGYSKKLSPIQFWISKLKTSLLRFFHRLKKI